MGATDIINTKQELTDEELDLLTREVERCPYFHAAALSLTHALYNRQSERYGDTLRDTAISIPDRTALFTLIEGKDYQLTETSAMRTHTVAGGESADRMTSLIDHFLGNLPEQPAHRPTPADASTDYMAFLLQNEGRDGKPSGQPLRGQSLIDNFIEDAQQGQTMIMPEPVAPPSPATTATDDNDNLPSEYLTETMAKIYIKQQKFDKASKIISRLNAKNPKKNRYFADQMRFLEKLMLNQRYSVAEELL